MGQGKSYPPAEGLKKLTWAQVQEIDRRVQEICAVGYGAVTVVIEKGLPRFMTIQQSEVLPSEN